MKTTLLLLTITLNACILQAQFGYPFRISNPTETFDSPTNIVSADMDNDGDIDLVAMGIFNSNVVWYENLDGAGNYGDPIWITDNASAFGPDDIVVGDLNNDGTLDVGMLDDDEFYWYENTIRGTCNFTGPFVMAVPQGTGKQLGIGDINGDNLVDIIIATNSYGIGWFKSISGNGDFEDYEVLIPEGRQLLVVADMDMDGDLDFVTKTYYNSELGISWIENTDGLGNFSLPYVIDVENVYPEMIHTADLDSDGDLDIVITDYQPNYVKWFKNQDGNGSFGSAITILEDTGSAPLAIMDIDNDTDLDLVLTVSGKLAVLKNTDGLGDFAFDQNIFQMYSQSDDIIAADVDGNGHQDIITVTRGTTVNIEQGLIIKNKGNDTFENPFEFVADADQMTSYEGFMIGADINGDGVKELVTGSKSYGRIGWMEFDNSEVKFKNPQLLYTNMNEYGIPHYIDFGDMDGDGDQDIVASFYPYPGLDRTLCWFENLDGAFDFGEQQELMTAVNGLRNVSLGDIDGDQDLDIYVIKSGGTDSGMYWLENEDGQGNFADPVELDADNSSNSYTFSILDDVDGDGDPDILVYSSSISSISWYQNNGGGFEELVSLVEVENIQKFFFEDMDGDSWKDLVYIDNNTITWHKHLNGTGSFGAENAVYVVNNIFTSDLVIGDGNSDGLNDFFVIDNGALLFIEQLSSQDGFYTPFTIPNMPEFGRYLNLSDLDGDGDKDLVCMASNTQSLFIFENYSNNSSITARIFLDENENGSKDAGEIALFNQQVTIEPAAISSYSTSSGTANFALGNGEYTVSCIPQNNFILSSPASQEVEVSDDINVDVFFGMTPLIDEVNALIEMTSAPTRCGFEVPFWIDFTNNGTVLSDITVSLPLDSLVTYLSADPVPDSIINEVLYWTFEDIEPTHAGQILVFLEIASIEFLGEWISMSVTANSTNGVLNSSTTTGYRSQINCALDPNDKLVEPNIPANDNYTLFGDTLDYTVRFQNTGTDTAFTVRIEDFLDRNLDWSTLHVVGASDPYEVAIDQQSGRTMFTFENILLPDSTTNEIESHGFIRYQIQHKAGLAENTFIANKAGIYFDFNPPIITNTVENILVSQYPLIFDIQHPTCNSGNNGSINLVFELPFYESYAWSNGSTGTFIDSLVAGEYHLVVTTAMGTQFDTTIILTEIPPFELGMATVINASCFDSNDGSISLEVTGGSGTFYYVWNNEETGPSLNQLPAGEYAVTVTDDDGCSLTEHFEIIAPDTIIIETTTTPQNGQDMDGTVWVQVSGGVPPYLFSWDHDASEASDSLVNLEAGEYTATVTDANGCSQVITALVDQVMETGELDAAIYFTVHPNPSEGDILIDFDFGLAANWSLRVYNNVGQLVEEAKAPVNGSAGQQLSLSLEVGLYSIVLFDGLEVVRTKLVVVK